MRDYLYEEKDPHLVSDINVTPFVDVMLVLLVIFMVTAPLMMQGFDVKVPAAEAPAIESPEERLVVTVDATGKIYIDEYEVALEDLAPKLRAIYANRQDHKGIFLRADRALSYGTVMTVMSKIREAGIEDIGLITEPPEKR
ncbi:protein TolR [Thermodesulforhabdus norvegica]|uniref:Cell division and transport-associated protein TolR n=1 Tax=Thermodesulforhabdus norvegica TaxID=39841 RepID=A0A1I4TEQ1_9BACT|nr:protein TolR [Thermodesulforhabdus norvegica]SFM75121.1 Cell division and transport-associated protein TolR [Thermodesulforhabdus norvegica]